MQDRQRPKLRKRLAGALIVATIGAAACGNENRDSSGSDRGGNLDREAACDAWDELGEREAEAIEEGRAWSDAETADEYATLADRTDDPAVKAELERLAELLRDPASELVSGYGYRTESAAARADAER